MAEGEARCWLCGVVMLLDDAWYVFRSGRVICVGCLARAVGDEKRVPEREQREIADEFHPPAGGLEPLTRSGLGQRDRPAGRMEQSRGRLTWLRHPRSRCRPARRCA